MRPVPGCRMRRPIRLRLWASPVGHLEPWRTIRLQGLERAFCSPLCRGRGVGAADANPVQPGPVGTARWARKATRAPFSALPRQPTPGGEALVGRDVLMLPTGAGAPQGHVPLGCPPLWGPVPQPAGIHESGYRLLTCPCESHEGREGTRIRGQEEAFNRIAEFKRSGE